MELSLYTLIALLLTSNLFWGYICLQLTNRLMSKDFGSYVQAVKKPAKIQIVPEDMSDPVAESHAASANSMIGVNL